MEKKNQNNHEKSPHIHLSGMQEITSFKKIKKSKQNNRGIKQTFLGKKV